MKNKDEDKYLPLPLEICLSCRNWQKGRGCAEEIACLADRNCLSYKSRSLEAPGIFRKNEKCDLVGPSGRLLGGGN